MIKRITVKIKKIIKFISLARPISKYEYIKLCSLINQIVGKQYDNIMLLRNDLMALNRMVHEMQNPEEIEKPKKKESDKKNGSGMYQ